MKNVNKNNFKILSTGIIIGGLIFGGVGVVAGTLTADQVKYTPSNEKFSAINAKEALDEIYKIAEYKIPENTYFYEDGTEGDSTTIVRYKKVDGEYYVCDVNGIVAEGTAATDVNSKTLVEYSPTAAGNLSAGSAGYASNAFLLGDGSDKKSYINALTYESHTGAIYSGTSYEVPETGIYAIYIYGQTVDYPILIDGIGDKYVPRLLTDTSGFHVGTGAFFLKKGQVLELNKSHHMKIIKYKY